MGEAVSFRAGSPGFGAILPLAEGGERCGSQLLRRPCLGEEEDALLPPGPARLFQAHRGKASANHGHRGPSQEPGQKAAVPEPSSLFLASLQRPKGHWGGSRLSEPERQNRGPSERQDGGVSQVRGPRGHEAAFAPESNQGPEQMCRDGQGQSWEEGLKCPFLWYLQTCGGRK